MRITPNSSSALSMGTVRMVRMPRPVGVLGVRLGIEHMYGTAVEGGARAGAGPAGHNRILFDEGYDFSGGVVGGDDAQILTVEAENKRSFRVAYLTPFSAVPL